jgi:hypothetical protein
MGGRGGPAGNGGPLFSRLVAAFAFVPAARFDSFKTPAALNGRIH